MKRRVSVIVLCLMLGITACGTSEDTQESTGILEEEITETETQEEEVIEATEWEEQESTEATGTVGEDYTEEITAKVTTIGAAATSLEDELQQVVDYAAKFEEMQYDGDYSQTELNELAQWPYVVWDAEVNSLWSRVSDTLTGEEKETVLEWQRAYAEMYEDMATLAISTYADGSISGLLYMDKLAYFSENRAYLLADVLAEAIGEDFTLPERDIYGCYATSEDNKTILNYFYVEEGMEADSYYATLNVDGVGTVEGEISEANGVISFAGLQYDISGQLTEGWDGATFTVTEVNGDFPFAVGDEYRFDLVF